MHDNLIVAQPVIVGEPSYFIQRLEQETDPSSLHSRAMYYAGRGNWLMAYHLLMIAIMRHGHKRSVETILYAANEGKITELAGDLGLDFYRDYCNKNGIPLG